MAIIGISGKIHAGKDLVGRIIQYHTAKDKSKQCFERLLNDQSIDGYHNSDWQVRKFAEKLKQIICILTGCTREQLESIEFKNSLMPKEWNYILHFLTGTGVSGKDSKLVPGAIKPEDVEMMKGRERQYTYRQFMQKLGTEALREVMHENVWVNALFADYKIIDEEKRASMGNVIDYSECFPKWIVTDVRFPNEFNRIKQLGGKIIRVHRPDTDHLAGNHASETAIDDFPFDAYLLNNGSIEQLSETINIWLIENRIVIP